MSKMNRRQLFLSTSASRTPAACATRTRIELPPLPAEGVERARVASGAVSGAFWGMLIGWLFMMPVASAALGAAGGALGGSLADVGINDST